MTDPPGILDPYAFPAADDHLEGASRAEVIPIARTTAYPAPTFSHAAESFLSAHTAAGAWSAGTAVKYRQTLATLARQLAERAPTAAADVAAFGTLAPATWARHLAALRSVLAWWRSTGWVGGDPTAGWARPKVTADTTRALARAQIAAFGADGRPGDRCTGSLCANGCRRAGARYMADT